MPHSEPHRPDNNATGPGATTGAAALLLSGARLTDGRTVDVRIRGRHIEAVATAGTLTAHGTRLDLRGYLLLPAPAEPHAHSDTALTAGLPGPPPRTVEDIRRRTTEAALIQLSHGATALRTHVHIGDGQGLAPLEAVLQARRSLRGLTDLVPVAAPRLLTGTAGADNLAMLRDAMEMGAGVIGGRPGLDPDPDGYTETVLDIAAAHARPVDLHTDGDDLGFLARLAAMAQGLRPGISIGPCAALSRLPADAVTRTADRLALTGVAVVCLPQGNCSGAAGSGTPPVPLLRAAGVRVAAGSGALRDTTNPVGRGDPLEAAYLLASQSGLSAEHAYDAVCASARKAMGLPGVRIEAGFPAELLAVRGEQLAGVLSLAYSRIVVHRGRVVARTSAVREYCDSETTTLDLPRQGRTDSGPSAGP